MSIAERHIIPTQEGPTPQYPPSQELFSGIENPDPKLIAAYDALTTTSPLRRRDPQILSELVFQEEISLGAITRKEAYTQFGGLSKRLEPFLKQHGIKIQRERGYQKGALAHLVKAPEINPPQTANSGKPESGGKSKNPKELKAQRSTNTRGQEFIDFPDPENKVLRLDQIEISEQFSIPQPSEIEEVIGGFKMCTKNRAMLDAIFADFLQDQMAFIRTATAKSYPDLNVAKGIMNFATATIHINKALRRSGIQIASLRIPSRRGESGMFYMYVKPNGKDFDIKNAIKLHPRDQIQTANNTPERVSGITPQSSENSGSQRPEAQEIQTDASITQAPRHETVTLRPGEDEFLDKLSELKATIEERSPVEHNDPPTDALPDASVETVLPQGVEVPVEQHEASEIITPPLSPEPVSANPEEEKEYLNLPHSTLKIITALFGTGGKTPTSISGIASQIRDGRKVRREHVQSALFSIQNMRLPDDSLITVTQTAGGRLDAHTFTLDYPEGWSLDQILQHLDEQLRHASESGERVIFEAQKPAFIDQQPASDIKTVSPAPQATQAEISQSAPLPLEDAFAHIRKEQVKKPDSPTLKINPKTFEWEFDGRKGRFPFGEELQMILRLAGKDGVDRLGLAGKGKPELAEKNFGNLQKMLDNPDRPEIFIRTGSGRFTTFKMNLNIEIIE